MADLPPFVPATTGGVLDVTGDDVTVGTGLTVLTFNSLGSADLTKHLHFALWVKNTGGTAFVECLLEQSPNGSDWEVTNNTTFSSLAGGALLSLENTYNSRKYLRVRARVAAGTTTAQAFLTGSVMI